MAPPRKIPASEPTAAKTRVLCVDDNFDMTAVMKIFIDADPQMCCVGCLSSADKLLKEVTRLIKDDDSSPLVVLLDANMPGKVPIVALMELTSAFPEVKVIVCSGQEDEGLINQAMQAGAWGCLSKRDDPEAILEAVRQIAAGKSWARTAAKPYQ